MDNFKGKTIHYVALGDSLAAGVNPFGEMSKGYPIYLKEKMGNAINTVQLHNFGIHGYTSKDLRRKLVENQTMRDEVKKATVITLNIGSNDFFYALKENPKSAKDTIKLFTENFSFILEEIKSINETANVYVLGYYNPFQKLPEKKKRKLTRILNYVNAIIRDKTETKNYSFVDTEMVINDSYESCLVNPKDFHLSSIGYELLASEIYKALHQKQLIIN